MRPRFLCHRSNTVSASEESILNAFDTQKLQAFVRKAFLTKGTTRPPIAWFLDWFSVSSQLYCLCLWQVAASLIYLQVFERPFCRCSLVSNLGTYICNNKADGKLLSDLHWQRAKDWMFITHLLLFQVFTIHLLLEATLWDEWLSLFIYLFLYFTMVILKIRTLRYKEVREFAQIHITSKW